jgi:excisionase family DNA binding protein
VGRDWLSTAHAAELTGYDDSHLRRQAGEGKLPALKRGKTWYVRRDALTQRRAEHDDA